MVWLLAGHDVFQEAREAVQVLMEQLCPGFHESMNWPSYPPWPPTRTSPPTTRWATTTWPRTGTTGASSRGP